MVLSFASLVAAQTSVTPPPAPEQNPFTLRANSSLVLVPAQVQTRGGEMIYDLKPEQFVLQDNGVAQTIHLEEDTDALGLSLVVVVQCSRAAFAQFDRMRGLRAMVDDVLGGGPHRVALISYGTEIEVLTPLTDSDKKLTEGFANLEPCEDEKDAATLDAVNQASHLLDQDPASRLNRRAILLIGETRDHGSKLNPASVIAGLGRSNTVVDAVSFNPGKDEMLALLRSLAAMGGAAPSPKDLILLVVNALRRNVPHTLASVSGGEYTNFDSQKGFERGVHRLANHIHNYYLLSFQPVGMGGSPVSLGLHRITVKVPDYPDAKIRYRLTYYAGEAPPPEMRGDAGTPDANPRPK